MALDMAKYRRLFLEEATEHLGEISRALLELEKDTASVESIDVIFRMAHSIKSMAGSLGYDSVTALSHALEDRMEVIRTDRRVEGGDELSLLFRGLEALERMVAEVAEAGEAGPAEEPLLQALRAPRDAARSSADAAEPKKKVLTPE